MKAKRGPIRSLVEKIRNRHQVLVIEADHQDLQQRSRLAICALSTSSVDIEARLRRVEGTVDRNWSGHVLSWEIEIVQISVLIVQVKYSEEMCRKSHSNVIRASRVRSGQ